MKKILLLAVISVAVLLSACNKSETYPTLPLSNYNLQVPGKYIIYQLDSLLYINFGSQDTVVSYYAKDSVDQLITDSLGQQGYRIFRFLRQSPNDPWVPNATFLTIPTANSVQYIDNNLRYIKLVEPIQNGYSWPGNSFIDTYDINESVPNLNDWDLTYLDDWTYSYANVNQPLTLSNNISLDSTITVNEANETIGDTTDVNSYSEVDYSVEQYAKGIGLVSRNFLHREYQPPTPSSAGYYVGYGVTLTMLDHN